MLPPLGNVLLVILYLALFGVVLRKGWQKHRAEQATAAAAERRDQHTAHRQRFVRRLQDPSTIPPAESSAQEAHRV